MFGTKRERNREIQDFLRRFSEFCRSESIEPRIKIYLLDKGYVYIPRTRNFTEDPKKKISGNQRFLGLGGVLEASYHIYYVPKGRVLPTLVFISIF